MKKRIIIFLILNCYMVNACKQRDQKNSNQILSSDSILMQNFINDNEIKTVIFGKDNEFLAFNKISKLSPEIEPEISLEEIKGKYSNICINITKDSIFIPGYIATKSIKGKLLSDNFFEYDYIKAVYQKALSENFQIALKDTINFYDISLSDIGFKEVLIFPDLLVWEEGNYLVSFKRVLPAKISSCIKSSPNLNFPITYKDIKDARQLVTASVECFLPYFERFKCSNMSNLYCHFFTELPKSNVLIISSDDCGDNSTLYMVIINRENNKISYMSVGGNYYIDMNPNEDFYLGIRTSFEIDKEFNIKVKYEQYEKKDEQETIKESKTKMFKINESQELAEFYQ